MTVLFSLNAFADNPDHYPKLNDLIDTVGKKGKLLGNKLPSILFWGSRFK